MVEKWQHLERTEATYYRGRNQCGGMQADGAKQLKDLDEANAKLKRLFADQALDVDILKRVNRGNF